MTLRFSWNGAQLDARPGDSIAAALAAAGKGPMGQAAHGRARGAYCGMGLCQDCLVVVDGQRSQRACLTPVRDGAIVTAQNDRAGDLGQDSPRGKDREIIVDLAIVGGGPAGLNAAAVAARGGASVLVIDERKDLGGQYFKPRSAGYRGTGGLDGQHKRGDALRARATASGAQMLTGHGVWYARARDDGTGFDLRTTGEGQVRITARAVILATGAQERPAPVPGWTRTGAMTIGAAQTLVRRYGVVPGARIIVASHGPLGLQLAAEITAAGGRVVALAERGIPRLGPALARAAWAAPGLAADGVRYRARLLAVGVPVLHGWELAEVLGDTAATGARLAPVGGGPTRQFNADTICAGDGFAPQIELARLLGVPLTLDGATGIATPQRDDRCATPIPGLWIAGDAGGLGGASVAAAQGEITGIAALHHLGRAGAVGDAPARLTQAKQFQFALWQLYAAPPRPLPADDVILCRCEAVSAGAVRAAITQGATDPGAVKRDTRLGMGRCQGRFCTAALVRMLGAAGHPVTPGALFAPQLPARAVTLGALAQEKPEWKGHRESQPGARPHDIPARPLTQSTADLAVIGGGVTGLSAALFAARSGAKVVVLDRGRVNGEASGGNAGSLHLQLLSWDFGARAVGESAALRTLPLQAESIDLWGQLETELNADFEMSVTGGLMVAENPDQIAFLRAKAEAEARVGVETHVIYAADIRRIAPALSHRFVAAAWCPGEGKINPLAGTTALAQACRAAGVVIEDLCPVTGLTPEGNAYAIATARGPLTAKKVLIAAGGWSGQVAAHLDVTLPIKGAPLQMIVTECVPPLIPCLIAHADRHLTMKQTTNGTVLIGGAWTARTDPSGQAQVLPDSLEGNAWVATRTVPALAQVHAIRSWAAMNIDLDGAPLLSALPGHPGVVVAATANGYTLGPLMGREAAALALFGRARQDMAPFTLDRFTQPEKALT